MAANEDIRNAISDSGIKHWQVAAAYGVSDGNFCRLLRQELPQSKKEIILKIINDLAAGKQPEIHTDDQQLTDMCEDSSHKSECFRIRLKYLVVFNRISYRKVALAIGISPQHMSKFVCGRSEPNLTILCKIADFFSVSVDYLLGREAK